MTPALHLQLLHFLHKLDDVFSEQLGLFEGGKVTAARHERVGLDVPISDLSPGFGTVHQLVGKRRHTGGHKNPGSTTQNNEDQQL